jgi:hypothetical protein
VRALCRRHETGGADGDGWDEQIKGGLTKLGAGQLAAPMGLSRNARLGDQLVSDRRHRGHHLAAPPQPHNSWSGTGYPPPGDSLGDQ